MFWKITGYICGNLLKHKEVSTFSELKESPFSSYRYTVEKFGEEFAQMLVRSVINIDESPEGEINLNDLTAAPLPRPAQPPPWAA